MAKRMIARYPGKCADCGAPIRVGDTIRWYARGRVYGVGCHANPNARVNSFGYDRDPAEDAADRWTEMYDHASPYNR
jgi:hypothetical protein